MAAESCSSIAKTMGKSATFTAAQAAHYDLLAVAHLTVYTELTHAMRTTSASDAGSDRDDS